MVWEITFNQHLHLVIMKMKHRKKGVGWTYAKGSLF